MSDSKEGFQIIKAKNSPNSNFEIRNKFGPNSNFEMINKFRNDQRFAK